MEKLKVKGLTGLIMSSKNPEKLAQFYINVIGLPLQLNKHGNLPAHWECDFEGIHYAILKDNNTEIGSSNFVPSFVVDDINKFIEQHELAMLHPLMNLGEGSYVGSIADADGNVIRLWMSDKIV
jgi:predicted enzyme related to lactoylglutathione lyase